MLGNALSAGRSGAFVLLVVLLVLQTFALGLSAGHTAATNPSSDTLERDEIGQAVDDAEANMHANSTWYVDAAAGGQFVVLLEAVEASTTAGYDVGVEHPRLAPYLLLWVDYVNYLVIASALYFLLESLRDRLFGRRMW